MPRAHTTGFALIQGRATETATDRDTYRRHKREGEERTARRREAAMRGARAAGIKPMTVKVPEGRSPDARRRVGQVQPAGWKM